MSALARGSTPDHGRSSLPDGAGNSAAGPAKVITAVFDTETQPSRSNPPPPTATAAAPRPAPTTSSEAVSAPDAINAD
eukprot:750541-Hanusia_phi.AAC.2